MEVWYDQKCIWQAWASGRRSMRQDRVTWHKFWTTTTRGWLMAVLLREMSGLEGKVMFDCSFAFNRCLRKGGVEAPRLWQKMASQLLAEVGENYFKNRCSKESIWRQNVTGKGAGSLEQGWQAAVVAASSCELSGLGVDWNSCQVTAP